MLFIPKESTGLTAFRFIKNSFLLGTQSFWVVFWLPIITWIIWLRGIKICLVSSVKYYCLYAVTLHADRAFLGKWKKKKTVREVSSAWERYSSKDTYLTLVLDLPDLSGQTSSFSCWGESGGWVRWGKLNVKAEVNEVNKILSALNSHPILWVCFKLTKPFKNAVKSPAKPLPECFLLHCYSSFSSTWATAEMPDVFKKQV